MTLRDRSDEVARSLVAIGEEAVSRMKSKLDAGARSGQIPPDADTLAVVHALNALFDGLALRAHEGLAPDLLHRFVRAGLGLIS